MPFSGSNITKFNSVKFNFIVTEKNGHSFTIILNRPEKRNAFTPVMVNEIAVALSYAQAKKDIWCVIFKANGPVFCAGMDLNVFQNPELDTANKNLANFNPELTFAEAFAILSKPAIAMVEGPVLAGGFMIVGACTFVIATEKATFSLPEVKRGLFPMQVLQVLLKIMSEREAIRLCILAETISAQQAKDLGIVSHISTAEAIDTACNKLVETIFEHSPFAISKGIEALNNIADMPKDKANVFLYGQLNAIRDSADAKEGIDAFREKRKPIWKNC